IDFPKLLSENKILISPSCQNSPNSISGIGLVFASSNHSLAVFTLNSPLFCSASLRFCSSWSKCSFQTSGCSNGLMRSSNTGFNFIGLKSLSLPCLLCKGLFNWLLSIVQPFFIVQQIRFCFGFYFSV